MTSDAKQKTEDPSRPEAGRTAFIYVARQWLKVKSPSLSFCQAFSLGNAKEKAEGSRASGCGSR
ncbi:MAG TPA: hypothetical protein VKV04_20780, partial [Verrucomicrobiae bacterium]|nr:hypothetical protein [Verrucomicrobiae bacterium]